MMEIQCNNIDVVSIEEIDCEIFESPESEHSEENIAALEPKRDGGQPETGINYQTIRIEFSSALCQQRWRFFLTFAFRLCAAPLPG